MAEQGQPARDQAAAASAPMPERRALDAGGTPATIDLLSSRAIVSSALTRCASHSHDGPKPPPPPGSEFLDSRLRRGTAVPAAQRTPEVRRRCNRPGVACTHGQLVAGLHAHSTALPSTQPLPCPACTQVAAFVESAELLRSAQRLLPRPAGNPVAAVEHELVGEERRRVLLAFAQVARAGKRPCGRPSSDALSRCMLSA